VWVEEVFSFWITMASVVIVMVALAASACTVKAQPSALPTADTVCVTRTPWGWEIISEGERE